MWRRLAGILALVATTATPAISATAVRPPVFEITPYYGYRLGGDFSDIYNYGVDDIEIKDGDVWGIIVTFNINPSAQIEMQYSQQSTSLQGSGFVFDPAGADLGELNVENWLVGASYTGGRPRDPVRGFIGASLGVTNFEPETADFSGDAYFAFGLYAGVKVALAKNFGLRFQGQWVSTWIGSSSDVVCDPYGYCYTVQDGGYLNQFELAAGITLKF
jgi:hypothetical protein